MKRINQCLNPQLIHICLKSFQVDKIDAVFQQLLPDNMNGHCRVSSFAKGRLLISVSGAFATEMRYLLPEIRDKLRRDHQLYQLMQCDVVIEEDGVEPKQVSAKKKRELSQQATQSLNDLAEDLQYPPLQKAIRQLAGQYKSENEA